MAPEMFETTFILIEQIDMLFPSFILNFRLHITVFYDTSDIESHSFDSQILLLSFLDLKTDTVRNPDV